MSNEYASIQIRIRSSLEKHATLYPVEAILDDGSQFLDGQMQLTQEDHEFLLINAVDPEKYGKKLFSLLFSGSIREAYDKVTGRAEVQTEGRLRVRLWIEDNAAELHALLWERLYHNHKGQMVPLASSILSPFSRYIGSPMAEPQPINTSPIRLLIVISNPLNLPCGLHPIDVEQEIKNLQQALGDLRQVDYIQVILMPGRSGLSSILRTQLEDDGYQVLDNVTSLDNILRSLHGCHVLHFLGHGFFKHEEEHGEGTAALYLEKEDGGWQVVKDNDLVIKLTAAGNVPHLVFLSACESAQQDAKAFVGLGPKLIKAGVPAVVAMQDLVPIELVQQLTDDFYRHLIEHGIIDLALNQARLLLFDRGTTNWSIPVLFTRLENGQLFTAFQKIERLKKVLSDKKIKEVWEELQRHYKRFGQRQPIYQEKCVQTIEALQIFAELVKQFYRDVSSDHIHVVLNFIDEQVADLTSYLNTFYNTCPPTPDYVGGFQYDYDRKVIESKFKQFLEIFEGDSDL